MKVGDKFKYRDVPFMRCDGDYRVEGNKWTMDSKVEAEGGSVFVFVGDDLVGTASNFRFMDNMGICDLDISSENLGFVNPDTRYTMPCGPMSVNKDTREIKKATVKTIQLETSHHDPRFKALKEYRVG